MKKQRRMLIKSKSCLSGCVVHWALVHLTELLYEVMGVGGGEGLISIRYLVLHQY